MNDDINENTSENVSDNVSENASENTDDNASENANENTDDNASVITEETQIKKKKKRVKWPLYVMLGVCIAAVLVFGTLLGIELYTDWESQRYYTELTSALEVRPRAPGAVRPPSSVSPSTDAPSQVSDGNEEDVIEDEEPVWLPYIDFETANEIYPGIVGWLSQEGGALDYPIMQWTNNDFFLNHLPDGTRDRSGSVFLDYRNSFDFSDISSLIYGHATRSKAMFGSLDNYRKQAYYDQNPVMYIYTPEADYVFVIFAGYLLDSAVEVPPRKFADEDAFTKHINNIKKRSLFTADVEVNYGDRIVNLCTCAYDWTNARLIIVGKLVEF